MRRAGEGDEDVTGASPLGIALDEGLVFHDGCSFGSTTVTFLTREMGTSFVVEEGTDVG